MHIGTCLLCLAVDRRTFDIVRSQLLPVYEKITDFKIKSDSHRLCFICHKRLQQAHQLRQLAKRTQHLLINFNTNKLEKSIQTHKSLVELSRCRVADVGVQPADAAGGGNASVKDEPAEDVEARRGDEESERRSESAGASPASPLHRHHDTPRADKPNTRARKRQQTDAGARLVTDNFVSNSPSSESLLPEVSAAPGSAGTVERDPPAAEDGQSAGDATTASDGASTGIEAPGGALARAVDEKHAEHQARDEDRASVQAEAGTVDATSGDGAAGEAAPTAPASEAGVDEAFPCRFCPFRSARRETLLRHERGHAGPRRYLCAHCGRHFPHKGNYVRHLRTHTGDRPFACDLCSATFAQLSTLNAHRLVHTGERPFECGRCGARFGRRGVLQRHEATHTGVKPHRCAECGSRFTRKSCLVDHERTHAGVKPYACDACPRSFFRKTDLNQHRRTHTGAKPYACDRCERRFAHKTGLLVHRRTHTADRPYRCAVCRRTFNQPGNLLRHARLHER